MIRFASASGSPFLPGGFAVMSEGYPSKPKRIPLFLPAPYLQALGNVSAYWAWLESAIEVIIWAFLKLDYVRGSSITIHMGLISRIQLLTILADLELPDFPEVHAHFIEMLQMLDAVRVKRNDYTHALWKHETSRRAFHISSLKRTAKGRFKQNAHHITLAELRDLAKEISWLIDGFRAFVEAMLPGAYVPWPRTPDEPKRRRRG
jgi:hypothetical protein